MALQTVGRVFASNRPLFGSVCYFKRIVPAAGIISKSLRDPDYKRPAPFPYETKKYTLLHWQILDGTYKRFDENSKLLVVDGNIGAGKTELAKHLAEELDMKFVPEPTMDRVYVTRYGYDLRQLDPIMPPSFKSCDLKTFYEDPYNQNVTKFQFRMFTLRLADYIDALAHVLNTGQGVVMDRCVYSDIVFLEAMYLNGYIRKEAREMYLDAYKSVTEELMRPCLIIYLDITPELAMQRIRERNNPIEVNSKVLNTNYLADIDTHYKQDYLKVLSPHCELLVYDWSHYGDPEVVVEDIEHIDFERYEKYEKKLKDWRCYDDWEWSWKRYVYTSKKDYLLKCANVIRPRVTEVWHPPEEVIEYKKIMAKVPGEKYQHGFNPDMGDSVLFKGRHKRRADEFEFFRPPPM